MTSVALCTYNGEKYIEEQISSILSQSVPVNEIVVCDDGSTDSTLTIIEKFLLQTKTNIRVYRNEKQLGVCANFQKAVDLCAGDIIFLSDQDDVWCKDKVKTICEWFRHNPTKNVVFTDAYLINETNQLIPNDCLWKRVKFSRKEQYWFKHGFALEVFLQGNVATGATMAFRSCSGPYMLVVPDSSVYHDELLAEAAMLTKSLGFIDEPLIKYRLHREQVCGMPVEGIGRNSAIEPIWNNNAISYLPQSDIVKFRIQFGAERQRNAHIWFGGFVFRHLFDYFKGYGLGLGMIPLLNDLIKSFTHSLYRIVNKAYRVIASAE